jgi:hypothetical protein
VIRPPEGLRRCFSGRLGGCLGWCLGWCLGGSIGANTSEPFLVLALLPNLRGSTLGRWRGIVKQFVKLRVVHINVDLSIAGGVTVGRIGERRTERHRLFLITDYHAVLHKVSRNPHDLSLVISFPRLGHTESDSLFRTRNGLERLSLNIGARAALVEGERSVLAIVATTRSRRRSSRRDKTWKTGSRRAGGRSNGRSSGRNTARSNGRSSGGSTARSSSRYGRRVRSGARGGCLGFDVTITIRRGFCGRSSGLSGRSNRSSGPSTKRSYIRAFRGLILRSRLRR